MRAELLVADSDFVGLAWQERKANNVRNNTNVALSFAKVFIYSLFLFLLIIFQFRKHFAQCRQLEFSKTNCLFFQTKYLSEAKFFHQVRAINPHG